MSVALAAVAATPECTPAQAPQAVSGALYRAVTTGNDPEAALGLRRELRALLSPGLPPSGEGSAADCEAVNRDSGATPGLIRHRLGEAGWLIQFACAQGAYQGSFWAAQLWSLPGGPAVASALCWPVPAEASGGRGAPIIAFAPQAVVWGELATVASASGGTVQAEIVNRFRAIGDCGTRSRYAVERGTARLVEATAAWTCPPTPDVEPLGPDAWAPVVLPHR